MAEDTPRQGEDVDTPSATSVPGRATTIAAMEHLVTRVAEGAHATDGRGGSEYLLFTCGATRCAVPLVHLREVLPALPTPVPLPFSPPWFFGIFPLRLDVLGLVDPAPLLLERYSLSPHPASTSTAIVAGGDTLLALAVSDVGDIAQFQPEDIGSNADGTLPTVAERYAVGLCSVPSGETYAVVDMPRLVEDLVRALMEIADNE